MGDKKIWKCREKQKKPSRLNRIINLASDRTVPFRLVCFLNTVISNLRLHSLGIRSILHPPSESKLYLRLNGLNRRKWSLFLYAAFELHISPNNVWMIKTVPRLLEIGQFYSNTEIKTITCPFVYIEKWLLEVQDIGTWRWPFGHTHNL